MSFPRYPSYKESGVEWLGDVPEHWTVQRLKRACQVFPSNVDKKTHEGETSVLLCNYTDVYYSETITVGMDFMAATASADQIDKFTLQAGDTIITKDSETADDIAVAAYVPADLPGVVCGYHLSMVRPTCDANGAFVKRLFDSVYAKSCFAVRAKGLTRVGLGQGELDNVELPFPPLSEQAHIATFLDRETAKSDALVAEQRRLIDLLKEKRQAVISHAVTKGLNPDAPMKPSGIEWLGDVPAHWEVWKLAHAFAVIGSGTTPKTDNREYYDDGDTPWINTGDLTDGELEDCARRITVRALADHASLKIYPAGSLLIAMYGATIGKLAILRFPAAVNQACCVFTGVSQIVSKFLFYWFVGSRQQILSLATGGGQPNVNQDILRALRVARPAAAEQAAIIDFLDDETATLDALTAEAERAIDLLQERRTALISAAVTGQIDVRPASERTAA